MTNVCTSNHMRHVKALCCGTFTA